MSLTHYKYCNHISTHYNGRNVLVGYKHVTITVLCIYTITVIVIAYTENLTAQVVYIDTFENTQVQIW